MTLPAPIGATETIRVRAGFELHFELTAPTPMMFIVEPLERPGQRILAARKRIVPQLPLLETTSYQDMMGNVVWRMLAPAGRLEVSHDLLVEVSANPDPVLPNLPKARVEDLPSEVLHYLLPSRYVDSDLLSGEAWQMFGHIQGGWAQVQAVCDHLQATLQYGAGSTSATTARESYQSGYAVCRDFAHAGVAFCRALNLPARYVCGYLADIDVPPDFRPMDFHAWFEVWLDGAWRTFDARHNFPRTGRILIATGRDAADTAFNTAFGSTNLAHMKVWADLTEISELPLLADGYPRSPTQEGMRLSEERGRIGQIFRR
ncbi:transglutaminase-like domain-containing protein [Deinococcus ruber]|uniref:Transglutaminase n=1 Tax=Deinococcus ruber TaxID=1848197 RepID=A0A918F9P6_9DEIO|nr:transglutaminase family protein [Deinococcus ruber]GGR14571.1 transglutaminase [Deinococcus ruber]